VAGARLHLLSDRLGVQVSAGMADEEGRFRLDRVGTGPHELIATTEDARGIRQGVRAGDGRVVVGVERLPGLRLVLEDEDLRPRKVNELTVVLLRSGEEVKRTTRRRPTSFARAAFRDLPPGTWDVRIEADGVIVDQREAVRIPRRGLAELVVRLP